MRKMTGLYVDYTGGSVATPDVVTAGEAGTLIGDVQAALDFLMLSWGDEEAQARVLQRLDEHAADLSVMLREIEDALDVDPDATLQHVRGIIHSAMREES